MPKRYYIKERHNPQFDKPYYSACGQLSRIEAKENSLYGNNVMLEYASLEEYNKALDQLKVAGYDVQIIVDALNRIAPMKADFKIHSGQDIFWA